MANIRATIIHALGSFQGNMQVTEPLTKAEAVALVDELSTTNLTRVALVHEDGSVSCFRNEILQQAVLVFTVTE